MLSILLLTGTAFPCAALLTNDEGAIATSDAQEVILEDREEGVRTHYRVRYDGDADSFGWLIAVHGAAGEGDSESNEDLFDELRDWTQPRKTSYSFEEAMAAILPMQVVAGWGLQTRPMVWRRVFSWRYRCWVE